MLVIYNIWAVIVGLLILLVYVPLYNFFPNLVSGPHSTTLFGVVATIIGGVSEYFGIRGRLFFLPIWLIGVGIICLQIGTAGAVIFPIAVAFAIYVMIKLRRNPSAAENPLQRFMRKRSPDSQAKVPAGSTSPPPIPQPKPTIDQNLEPETPLESALYGLKYGGSRQEIFAALKASELIVLLDKADGQPGSKFLQIPSVPANDMCLAVFTSPKRAATGTQRYPAFGFQKTVSILQLLEVLPPHIGIILNPGWNIGLHLAGSDITQLKQP